MHCFNMQLYQFIITGCLPRVCARECVLGKVTLQGFLLPERETGDG